MSEIPDNAFIASFHDEGGCYLGDTSASSLRALCAENERLRERDVWATNRILLEDEYGKALKAENERLREALPALWGQYDDGGRKLWVDPEDDLRAENKRLREALHLATLADMSCDEAIAIASAALSGEPTRSGK